MRRIVLAVIVTAALAAGALTWRAMAYLDHRVGGAKTVITVDHGTRLRPVLRDLAQRGVLTHPLWLYAYARLSGQTEVRAGGYAIEPEQTPRKILEMLHEGEVRTASFTVVPGSNHWEVRAMLAKEGWMDAATFDRLCDDKKFLAAHDIPGPTCEGYIFPETYTFALGIAPEKIFSTVFATFRRAFAQVTADGRGPLDLKDRQLVTLASIVEKETGSPDDRPHIACVFYNRLEAHPPWRLQTDPTVIYAATLQDPNFDGNITRYHLRKMDNPYNTYEHVGLPPGPIANPGRAAFEAVVHPDTCKDFYFVSMNNGKTRFCPTLACQNREVQKWQIDYFRHRHHR